MRCAAAAAAADRGPGRPRAGSAQLSAVQRRSRGSRSAACADTVMGEPPDTGTDPTPGLGWGPRSSGCGLLAEVAQQPQDLQVEPDQGDRQAEGRVPRE